MVTFLTNLRKGPMDGQMGKPINGPTWSGIELLRAAKNKDY